MSVLNQYASGVRVKRLRSVAESLLRSVRSSCQGLVEQTKLSGQTNGAAEAGVEIYDIFMAAGWTWCWWARRAS